MRKTLLIIFASLLMSAGRVHAQWWNPITKIIITTDGGSVAYVLTDMPTITRADNGGKKIVNITIKGQDTPVASLELSDDKPLEICYGTYFPSAIKGIASDKVTVTEKNGKKYVTGGKLIIIDKDGKMYDAAGKETK